MEGNQQTFKCLLCNHFHALSLRSLLNHYRIVHVNQSTFNVTCNVDGCPATFSLYNSFYKHVTRKHYAVYSRQLLGGNPQAQHPDAVDITEDNNQGNFDDIDAEVVEDTADQEDQNSSDDHLNDDDDDDDDEEDDEPCQSQSSSSEDEQDPENNAANNFEDDPEICLKKSAAMFLLKSKERNKLSQATMDKIRDNVSCLVVQHNAILKSKVIEELNITENDHISLLDEIFGDGNNIFEGLSTEAQQKSFIKSNFSHVKPIEIILGSILVRKRKKNQRFVTQKNETMMYIPILETLEQMLSNKKIFSVISKPTHQTGNGYFYDIFDGSVYTSDQYFKDHPSALAIILFHDEVEICNPLGSAATKYKIDMYYYCVANISPKYRSRVCAVQLLAIVKASHVKKYGISKILDPIINDLILLHHGHTMNFNNEEKVVFGKVVMCLGDTLGQHLWGGFKEGVGGAYQKCRHCFCDFQTLQTVFDLSKITQRTEKLYDEHCSEIENATGEFQNDLKITYGINRRSPLCKLPNFNITTQLPQDIMHILFEGTVQYELRLVLKELIYTQKAVSLDSVNGSISSHLYGYSEISSKPPPIRDSVFENNAYKLKFEADQARLFLRLFPLLICPYVGFDNEYVKLIVDLIEICKILVSPVIGQQTITLLKERLPKHLQEFKRLFPDKNILPKHNYMLHFIHSIEQLGPPIRYSCYSFEAAHKYFKGLAKSQNFKNLPFSLANRHQYLDTANYGDNSERCSSHPLFDKEQLNGVVKPLDENEKVTLRNRFNELNYLPGIDFEKAGFKASWVIRFGTKYCRDAFVAVNVNQQLLPLFGKIKQIYLIRGYLYFEVQDFETVCFDDDFQAHQVEEKDDSSIVPYESLIDYNVFHLKIYSEYHYIQTKYFLGDIIRCRLEGRYPLRK
ncbi:uncharacterized protein [Clytia hemisphaerica]|uniref:C2H2-type domain-containing protein n=1 Tax=Clytia hemisphaerica TaxID=252671 RepID=A0A7M5US01_9CNID|eukprot:TCONS_00071794-protein